MRLLNLYLRPQWYRAVHTEVPPILLLFQFILRHDRFACGVNMVGKFTRIIEHCAENVPTPARKRRISSLPNLNLCHSAEQAKFSGVRQSNETSGLQNTTSTGCGYS